ncbi:MAG TPA: hypothetical protein VID68_11995 [Solirubrobacteraceae bacterium]
MLVLIATAGILAAPLAAEALASSPFTPRAVYHISGARVTTTWAYDYSGTDDSGNPFSSSGGESANLTLGATDRSSDRFGIYTARLTGTLAGSYSYSSVGNDVNCPSYSLDPAAVQEQVQLNLVSLPGHRVEINASLGPGQTTVATSALQQEFQAVDSTCGDMPTNLGYGLTYSPAPNNVHTPQCDGIADGCAIVRASAFRSPSVTVHINVSDFVIPPGFTVIPSGANGHDLYTWSITVTLKRA